ncbi:hypothetical protein WICMUC_000480 [Wickerhamomyces mucosus]|uniref:V-type proton ATPase subunit E n=1 Tax=Wickerhamomyces mucosus TaxID=1378264 RepID=A0A9P8PZ40_9ASCO|nr:hypothetical protein WICMUC_000480 [Wickerhamomyces mucosus]
MATRTSLSDDQVNNELNKMKLFITKEAEEKSKEVRVKADEEYEIEKANSVRSETSAIDAVYEQKFKKASLAQQITKSTIANKTRLKVLSEKSDVLGDIFETAQAELKKLKENKEQYLPVLEGLIEEGSLSLLEKSVTVRVLKSDVEIAKGASIKAAEKFKEATKFDIEITVDEENFLDEKQIGGVVIINPTGKIEVRNTLEARLELLQEESLPAIRLALFGPTASRKFFD